MPMKEKRERKKVRELRGIVVRKCRCERVVDLGVCAKLVLRQDVGVG